RPLLCGHWFVVVERAYLNWTSASVSELTVRHGDNITLYCDCKMEAGQLTVWFRISFHENQPVLVLDKNYFFEISRKTRFIWTKNVSSDSYDLTIINVTCSDEGFYYCGTEGKMTGKANDIDLNTWYKYSNIIRKISISKYFTQISSEETFIVFYRKLTLTALPCCVAKKVHSTETASTTHRSSKK
uniref:Ig-like domain-containing protein n=1 Tax=Oryzias latipes TaxID=8090 RepID=A0A3P9HB69_ORYLA